MNSHIRNADGAFLVYDINSELSFSALHFWLECIKSTSPDVVIYLVGNKSDLAIEDRNLRKVSKDLALNFVQSNNIKFWTECSAKKNINIRDTFKSLYKCKLLVI